MLSEALRHHGPVPSFRHFVQEQFPGAELTPPRDILLAFPGDPDGPACVREHLPQLAELPALLEQTLARGRTPLHQALSLRELARPLTPRLKRPFQETVARRIRQGRLPATIGCLMVRDEPRLFLLADLGGGQTVAVESEAAFDAAFARLDQARGGYNLVSLRVLREALGWPRSSFDALLLDLRERGRYSLSAAEGRTRLDEADRGAALVEEGTYLLYVARCRP